MEQIKGWLLKVILAAAIIWISFYLYSRFGPALPITTGSGGMERFLEVTATGQETVVPDMGEFYFEIRETHPKMPEAQAELNRLLGEAAKVLKEVGIEEKDIKTVSYNARPRYEWTPQKHLVGQEVSSVVIVKVRDLGKLNEVTDAVVQLGVAHVGDTRVTVSDEKREVAMARARDRAIQEAKSKAEALARSAGISLGRVVNVREIAAPASYPFATMAEESAHSPEIGSKTDIHAGTIEVTARVTLYFDVR